MKNRKGQKSVLFVCLTALLMTTFAGCANNKTQADVDSATPVDITDVIAYYVKTPDVDAHDLIVDVCGYDTTIEHYFVTGTSYAIQLPQYANSEHPFLAQAEVLYNALQFSTNAYSNFEWWIRGDQMEVDELVNDAIESVEQLDERCIKDDELQDAARIL